MKINSEAEVLSPTKRALLAVKEMKAKLEALEYAKNEPIAIIGMGCRFPSANNPKEFWELLRDGRDVISEIPKERWDIDAYYDPDPDAPGKMSTRFGGFLEKVDEFDPVFFNISPREAVSLDPQQRLLLEVSWEAIENSGLMPQKLPKKTGVFVGISDNNYFQLMLRQGFAEIDSYLSSGNSHSTASGRLSYFLNLTGPCLSVDTACSSSLVAVHLACQSIRNSECDLALAGGVNLILTPEFSINLSKAHMLSPDGRCKTFDAAANGYVRSEGCGVILLKRLSDARANGDNILAVVRGSAINQDGRTSGLTVPHGPSQQAVIRQALENGNVQPDEVSYVEAHGTGTSLGDPIEVGALGSVFSKRESPLTIGSAKTNIGHLEAAAGIAGLIKVVLSLKHGEIPPSLHFHKPNPHTNWNELPVRVATERIPWSRGRRLAGVSSFGFSGTNAHVVLEEAPRTDKKKVEVERPLHPLCLSAKTKDTLKQLVCRYEQFLATEPILDLGDVCFTANTGRAHFNHRLCVLASDVSVVREKLASFIAEQEVVGMFQGHFNANHKIAFLFTGQGSQYIGMGRQLYETQPTFRQILNRCDQILRPYLELSLLEVLYPSSEPSHLNLNQTAYTQPALFALEYALVQLWKSWGIEPDVVIGHSVGEYVAACVAGVFSLEDGLKLIASRGKLMQALPRDGEMVALLASEEQALAAIEPYIREISIAAINGPRSLVISGRQEAIKAVCTTLEAQEIKTKKLNVSHAFHSPLMEPMLADFEQVARKVSFCAPQIKLLSNVTGKLVTDEVATPEYWCRHVLMPVKWAESMENLDRQGVQVLIEIGPQPILLGMGRQCIPEHQGLWLPSLCPNQEDWQQLLTSLAELYVYGTPIDWIGFDQGFARDRIPLPTYPFQRQHYWVNSSKDNKTKALALINNPASYSQNPLLGQQLYLAGTPQIRFQGQISKNFPAWLKDHRVFKTTIVPGTAYLEMALAAGQAVTKSDNLRLEEVAILRALILPENGAQQLIQLILTPEGTLAYFFEIFSLKPPNAETQGQPSWILHASGKLLVKDKESQAETIDLTTLQAQCQEEISIDLLYQRFQEQNIDYGSSFRAVKQVWRHETVALGKICLPEQLRAEVEDYQLHPVLLDACLQTLDATLLENNNRNTYVPIGIEQLQVYTRHSACIWCYAQLRKVEGERQKTLIKGDLRLFAPNGQLIAILEGLQLKYAPRETMLDSVQKPWQDWLYKVEWQPRGTYGLLQDYLPTLEVSYQGILLPQKTVIVERAEAALKIGTPKNWLILADGQGIGQQLGELLRLQGENCTLVFPTDKYEQIARQEFSIDPANPNHFQQLLQTIPTVQGVVYLWSLDTPEDLSETDLEEICLKSCGSVLNLIQALAAENYSELSFLGLVTRGAQVINEHHVQQVAQSPLWGLGKVIALEHPELNCTLIDLDLKTTEDEARILFEEISSEDEENQVAFRDQTRYVARLVRYSQFESQVGATQLEIPENQPFRLEVSQQNTLESLQLQKATRRQPNTGEVEIRVRAAGLNFRDVLNALGLNLGEPALGSECAGEVVAVGAGVKGIELGDAVIALAEGGLSQYVTLNANLVVPKPAALTFEEAATIPVAFLTAYWSLHHIAKITSKDRVLIHAATGGVGQAAVQLALQTGAEVFGTTSLSKWQVLKFLGVKYVMNSRTLDFANKLMAHTNGQGVDIVLNSLTGEGFVQKSLEALAKQGRMIELAKRDIWSAEKVASLRPDVSYTIVDLGPIAQKQSVLIQSMLRELMQQFEDGSLKPLPQTIFPIQDAVSAFRYMQQAKHTGKIVITFPEKSNTQERLTFRSDSSYLITGGWGGLGLLVAQWLVERGARHLV
ncbi:polyketide synthase dehydratase domain-containing protein, partial [Nostoc sp. CHAB 5824]|nr:polyketide synthase dehydratase domain-containing protein [Nostoc sp. CHAB 5824]